MKVTSCDCFENKDNVWPNVDIDIDYPEGLSVSVKKKYGEPIYIFDEMKYCPFCGKKIEVQE